jgi:hypothetical protein
MPTFVMKVAKDRDQYIGWSTVVENIVWVGNREEAAQILARDIPAGYDPKPGNSPEDRLRRADESGTSALYPTPEFGPYDGAWDDDPQIVEQRGLLARGRVPAFVDAYLSDNPESAYALLRPFDDEDEVRS